jgi:hypothetical protein
MTSALLHRQVQAAPGIMCNPPATYMTFTSLYALNLANLVAQHKLSYVL